MGNGEIARLGDMGSVFAVGRNLARSDRMHEATRYVASGLHQLQSAGSAKTLTRLVAACRPIESAAQLVAAAQAAAAAALEVYAREVSELQQEGRRLSDLSEAARARWNVMSREFEESYGSDQESIDRTRRLGGLVEEADDELRGIEQALFDVDEARMRADRRCADALNAQTGALHALKRDTVGSAGVASPMQAVHLAVQASPTTDRDLAIEALTSATLSVNQNATVWEGLDLTPQEVRDLPMKDLFALANVDGLPAWARDIASRKALDYALSQPATAYGLMGFTGEDMSQDEFVEQVTALKASLEKAESNRFRLRGKPPVQMLGFDNHDGALTTAISFGDLDTASNVGANVPGMGAKADDLDSALRGAQELFRVANEENSSTSYAVVTWLGYRTPGMPPDTGVLGMDRANAGAPNLARFLDGIHALRSRESSDELDRLVVFAHSYGSTTAGQALKLTTNDVDAFVTYGSAGLAPGTALEELHAADVFSTKARGDNVAGLGYSGNDRVDPRAIGAQEFDADSGEKRVTAHDMFSEDAPWSVWNWGGDVGYLSIGTSTLEFMGRSLVGTP
ncbi:hypothetical protein GCM10009786_01600 [Leucobacter alluvii]|uniref:DUF1023 domain-containing protein n=1 Tax=Leucobacter alluvii TaxID=340321 RepID=A0ABN3B2W7_9MICO